jgi:predicted outer membrane protein
MKTRRIPRWLVATLALSLAFMVTPTGTAHAADNPVPVPPNTGLTDNGAGVVSAADRDFVVKVRLAGLWEVPAGNLVAEKSENPVIKKIGADIAKQHESLDALDRAVAAKLGILLPNKPNGDQQAWLNEMMTAPTPKQLDQIFIDRLRAAHGNIFPAIATIRGTTRNDSVRKLAQQTNQFVMTHMTLLESSGIVDYAALPTAPAPKAAAGQGPVPIDNQMLVSATSGEKIPGLSNTVILLVLAAALVVGVVTTMRIFRAR